jgi:hypothetical protein
MLVGFAAVLCSASAVRERTCKHVRVLPAHELTFGAMWLDWIHEEQKHATTTGDQEFIDALFLRCFDDYLCEKRMRASEESERALL